MLFHSLRTAAISVEGVFKMAALLSDETTCSSSLTNITDVLKSAVSYTPSLLSLAVSVPPL